MGSGSGGRGDPAALGGTVVLHRMVTLRMGQSSGGGVRVCARTWLLVGCGCACVRARDSVCYNIHFSLSPMLQLVVFR